MQLRTDRERQARNTGAWSWRVLYPEAHTRKASSLSLPRDSTTDTVNPWGSCELLPVRPYCLLESCPKDTGENNSQHILSAPGLERHVCMRMKESFDENFWSHKAPSTTVL